MSSHETLCFDFCCSTKITPPGSYYEVWLTSHMSILANRTATYSPSCSWALQQHEKETWLIWREANLTVSLTFQFGLQVQLLCAAQAGAACVSQAGGEGGDFLPRDWVDWEETSERVPGKKKVRLNMLSPLWDHKICCFHKAPSLILFRKCLCCQTWMTSTSLWCTRRKWASKHEILHCPKVSMEKIQLENTIT